MDLAPHRIPPEPSWRKPVGMLGLIAYIAIYALIVSVLADYLIGLPRWLETLAYLVAGIAWVAPLKPLFLWMNTGRWRMK
jgi:predicted membrane channel-forming protein YqfA (hemolysin III family)